MHFRRKTILGEIITYIRVRVRVVPWRTSLGHEAQLGEVAFPLPVVDLLILFWTWWVFTWDVEVAQGYTCSGHDLLDVLLLLVSEAILLLLVVLIVILVAVVILVAIVILVGVVVLLPLGAVGDNVGGVTTVEAAPGVSRVSSPLLPKLVHRPKFSWKQGNIVIGNALVLLNGNYNKGRQRKHEH
jgi:hypothetical protein